MVIQVPQGVEVRGEIRDGFDTVLTPAALALVADLHRRFEPRRQELLAARRERQTRLNAGGSLDFLPETADVRLDSSWQVAPPAPRLEDRGCEMTGPTADNGKSYALEPAEELAGQDPRDGRRRGVRQWRLRPGTGTVHRGGPGQGALRVPHRARLRSDALNR